ncbi:hypothetical protein ACFORL_11665 [Legionella dresdenensis]|uniref:Coiled-coil protein n=1 Tax=Legionella dresdenensis TaxID=450200 RepID=A0ABV8CIA1_9GAMM
MAHEPKQNHSVIPEAASAHEQSLLQMLKDIQRPVTFKPNKKTKDTAILSALKQIPFVSSLLHGMDGTGTAIGKLYELQGVPTAPMKEAVRGFQFGSIALAALDFLRIPAIYIASFVLGKKSPVSLSKNAQWLYAGVLLALGAVSIAVPAVSLPLAVTGAALALAVNLYTLGRFFYLRRQNRHGLKKVEQQLQEEEARLDELRQKALDLENEFATTKDPALIEKIEQLHKNYQQQLATLQTLHDQKYIYEQKIDKRGLGQLINRSAGILLSTLALTSLVLIFFMPPVGLGMLAGSAAAGIIYGVLAFSVPYFIEKFKRKEGIQSENVDDEIPEEPGFDGGESVPLIMNSLQNKQGTDMKYRQEPQGISSRPLFSSPGTADDKSIENARQYSEKICHPREGGDPSIK